MTTHKPQYLINGSKELITPFDRGFAYGDGIFRTLKIKHGKPLAWDMHYQKLVADCNKLKIVCPSADMLLADIHKLFFGDIGYAVAKIIVSRGESERGYALPVLAQPTRVVIKSSLPSYPEAHFNQGVRLYLCELRLADQPSLAGIKHLNRLENIMARMEWTDSTFADGVLLDKKNNVIECTASNILVRFNDTIITPNLIHCGVAGVTRDYLMDSVKSLGLKTKVANLPLSKFMQADEIIICNSLYGAWQVIEFNGHMWQTQGLANQCRALLKD